MGAISYEVRPTKAVTREVFVDVLSHLTAIAPLASYQYVGMGAVEFLDFDLVHRRLGINRMISIEEQVDLIPRCKFNRPFSSIEVIQGTTGTILPSLAWGKLSAVWLDYTSSLTEAVIADVRYLARVLIPGSILAVTLNAEPFRPLSNRLEQFKELVGESRVPSGASNETLGEWGLAQVQRSIAVDEIEREMADREDGSVWLPLLNLQYSDSARMQLFCGIVQSPGNSALVGLCNFDEVPEYRADGSAVTLRVPLLTARERHWLDQRLPNVGSGKVKLSGVNGVDVADYISIYRRLQAIKQ